MNPGATLSKRSRSLSRISVTKFKWSLRGQIRSITDHMIWLPVLLTMKHSESFIFAPILAVTYIAFRIDFDFFFDPGSSLLNGITIWPISKSAPHSLSWSRPQLVRIASARCFEVWKERYQFDDDLLFCNNRTSRSWLWNWSTETEILKSNCVKWPQSKWMTRMQNIKLKSI